ncbi:MAG: NADH-quinone oxidoreductase subunit A [Pirellulaceae bacterium]|nr:NADH-quinone oxidoreductase subunit A [Planctomycetales bacterium]
MVSALGGSAALVAYLALFAAVGLLFVFINLLVGRFVRPSDPHPEKQEIYECGEPTIGSSFVQFDLRFYVVALIFIVFDVEVAFLFPWAAVFGKASHLSDPNFQVVVAADADGSQLTPQAQGLLRELGMRDMNPVIAESTSQAERSVRGGARMLLKLAAVEMSVFFVILLIAFAYIWRAGALDWVRALVQQSREIQRRERMSRAANSEYVSA